MKVNLFIIGAARSATTSLSNLIAAHPDVCFSKPKEPQFFSDSSWRDKTEHYHSKFFKEAKIYAEGSTNYTKIPAFNTDVAANIHDYNPDAKLIYMMRHPIERILSHYYFAVERGYTEKELNKEVIENPIYLQTSRYFALPINFTVHRQAVGIGYFIE